MTPTLRERTLTCRAISRLRIALRLYVVPFRSCTTLCINSTHDLVFSLMRQPSNFATIVTVVSGRSCAQSCRSWASCFPYDEESGLRVIAGVLNPDEAVSQHGIRVK